MGECWGYEGEEGPEHWADLSPDFVMCREGVEQSPIDLTGAESIEGAAIERRIGTEVLTLSDALDLPRPAAIQPQKWQSQAGFSRKRSVKTIKKIVKKKTYSVSALPKAAAVNDVGMDDALGRQEGQRKEELHGQLAHARHGEREGPNLPRQVGEGAREQLHDHAPARTGK